MDGATPIRERASRQSWRGVLAGVARWVALLLVALSGAGVGWSLSPTTTTFIGPLEVQVDLVPSLDPGVRVQLPPIGEVEFDTHTAPVAVLASVKSVDLDQAQRVIASPQGLLALQLTAPRVIKDAAREAIAWDAGCALAGALVATFVVYRTKRRTLEGTAMALVVLVLLGSGTAATFDSAALRQPRFTGLLSRAPYIGGEGRAMVDRLESYRSGLADFVQSVTTLYALADQLPVQRAQGETTTVLHISDIHLNPLGFDLASRLVTQFGVDVVVDTGDITTWGTEVESSTLSRVGALGVPYVFVRGNHDSLATQAAVAAQPNAVVLDGDVREVDGLTFAGVGDPVFTPDGEGGTGDQSDRELVATSTQGLADVVAAYDASDGTTARGVDVAVLHDPSRLDPLFGEVPLILAGHYHRRFTRVDEASGTRVMVEGSTGGAGLTANGLRSLSQGEPVPLTATLLYFATTGDRAGRLVAYDEVTVGGLGLTSVTVQRTTVPVPDAVPRAETPETAGSARAPGTTTAPPSRVPTVSPTRRAG
jgi:predicted MPP superfamily phosphohydrolase